MHDLPLVSLIRLFWPSGVFGILAVRYAHERSALIIIS